MFLKGEIFVFFLRFDVTFFVRSRSRKDTFDTINETIGTFFSVFKKLLLNGTGCDA